MARVDYSSTAAAYRTARTLPPEIAGLWGAAIGRSGVTASAPVLDVGAGTGGFLQLLGEWFDVPVVALEPSAGMRADAAASGSAALAPYVAGWAEAMPLRAAAFDVVWISTVFHQLDDPVRAVAEVDRVLRPDGHVVVRSFFSDVPMTNLLGRFPGSERGAATFPSTDEVRRTFEAAGFTNVHQADVVEPWRFDATTWAGRVRSMQHTDSALRPLHEHEVEAGIAAVLEAHGDSAEPLVSDTTLRLLVLARQ